MTEMDTVNQSEQPEVPEVVVSCSTGRGVTPSYWKHFSCYELSAQDVETRVARLRQWRETAPSQGIFVARIAPEVITEMSSPDRGISSSAEAEIARALSRVEALHSPLLLLHTPSKVRPSRQHEAGLRILRERLPTDLPLAWRADGLWGESESHIELCQELGITPVIDPLMWDEEAPLPQGALGYWRVMGGAGLSPRLSEYEVDKLLDLADQWLTEAQSRETVFNLPRLWVHFTAVQMERVAQRWRETMGV